MGAGGTGASRTRAYVEARYSKHYRITKELLTEATASVEALQRGVKNTSPNADANVGFGSKADINLARDWQPFLRCASRAESCRL